jgi:hypothetical protein
MLDAVMRLRALVVAVLLLLGSPAGLRAERRIPGDQQASMILRMLHYDRALKGRVGATLTLGIVAKASDQSSVEMVTELEQAFAAQQSVQGLPLAVKVHLHADRMLFADWVASEEVDVLYVAGGLDKEIKAIVSLCEQKRVVGVSALRVYVKQGLSVGVVDRVANAGLLVNLPVARTVGMDLDPKLLNVAEIMN